MLVSFFVAFLGVVMVLVGLGWGLQLVRKRPQGEARRIVWSYTISWLVGATIAFLALALPDWRRFAILALGITFLTQYAYLAVLGRRS
jgi:hypothetical protein